MEVKRTLVSIVGSAIVVGSSMIPSCQPVYARDRDSRVLASKQESKIVELTENNNRFVRELPMQLYTRAMSGTKDFEGEKIPIQIEGEMDYKSGKFYFAYSAGRMGNEGPSLGKRTSEEARTILPANLPSFDDSKTQIYVVSTSGDVQISDIDQKAWIHLGKQNPVTLRPLEEHRVGKFAWWLANRAFDYGIAKGDAFLTGGLTVVPYVHHLDPEVLSWLVDSFDLGPLSRTRSFLEKKSQEAREQRKEGALGSLENAVYVAEVPLFSGFANRTARSFDVNLKNNSFEDQQFSFLIKNLAIGNESRLHGNVQDVSLIVNLPSQLKDYLGDWNFKGVMEEGRFRDIEEIKGRLGGQTSLVIGKNAMSLGLGKDGDLLDRVSCRAISTEKAFVESASQRIAFLFKKEGEERLLMESKNFGKISSSFGDSYLILDRVSRDYSSVPSRSRSVSIGRAVPME
jgi:hypothetical protein